MRHYVHKIKFDTLRARKPRNRAGSNELYCQSKFVGGKLLKFFCYMVKTTNRVGRCCDGKGIRSSLC